MVNVADGEWLVKPPYTLASFRSLGREGKDGKVGGCPRSVFLVKRRSEWAGGKIAGGKVGGLVRETAELVEVGCRGRTCPVCSVGWRRYHLARMFSGTEVPMERQRFWTITAPGSVSDVEAWNRSFLERWKLVWRGLRRLHPPVSAYYGVKEFQERGVFHGHLLIRQESGDPLPRSYLGRGGALEGLLVRQGFGPMNRWQEVYGSVGSACGYLGKYLLKGVHDPRFPKWSHVDFWSRDWSQVWSQHQSVGEVVGSSRARAWEFTERWEYGGRTVGESLRQGSVDGFLEV